MELESLILTELQIADLRETIEQSDEEPDLSEPTSTNAIPPSSPCQLLFRSASSCRHKSTVQSWPKLTDAARSILLRLYCERVDCLYKILHWPTVLADIQRLSTGTIETFRLVWIRTLELSIFLMALCSITDDEAKQFGLGDRKGLIEQYREACEMAFTEADLLQKPNLVILQALVIYLVSAPSQ